MKSYIEKISSGDAESVDMNSNQLELAAKYVEQQVDAGYIPLGYVMVVRKGKIVLDKYFVHPNRYFSNENGRDGKFLPTNPSCRIHT